ncbi:PA2169 family four-helix-bundle protein [Dyella flava]|uniref:PA2169 family four-helix-bundle protein n=1 Tax=Dyella flava TaxID=1920170 RepID=A0ABS2K1P3_9GAMM|nr:PA2169 family four-helix-bundle protein [Dyella flava]MBM7125071.1 PA2169 family four-helix-bundle protein [Dyella flava]GLQ51944.1 hypothetical protein GCM10010872_33930 [Dyella flava]
MGQRHYDIRVLNRLISFTLDSAADCRRAMSDVRSAELTYAFRGRCRERLVVSSMLREQVDAIGGDPSDDGTLRAALQRALSNLYYALHGGDWVVVRQVEHQESKLREKYDSVLNRRRLSQKPYQTVLRAYESLRAAREELAILKRVFPPGRH